MITHATVRVTGERSSLEPFRERLGELLAGENLAETVSEHHGGESLHYDLKVTGGVPFPPFVRASEDFPLLTLAVEWIGGEGEARGAATIQEGRLVSHEAHSGGTGAGGAAFVSVDRNHALEIGFQLLRVAASEWRGYVVRADRDALFRISRDGGARRAELWATAGATPEWQIHWVVDLQNQTFEESALAPGIAIAEGDYRELLALAEAFAGEWLWFASAPAEEIAIERQRYDRLGYAVREANVRAAKLNAMAPREGGGRLAGRLDTSEQWIREVLEQCWAIDK
jgi:hypothetical protein